MAKALRSRNTTSEVQRLRARLTEAEETLNAIRTGEVDAIAVDGPHGRQIFTLQSADQPYRILAERMSEGAASLTADGTILFCNERLAEMVGQPAEKLVGSSVTALIPVSEREHFQQLLTCGLECEAREEVHFQRNDGSLIPVLASLKVIPAEAGRGLCMIATDLSWHKQAEDTIRLQANRHAALVSTTADGYWCFDRNGKLLDVNDTYCRMSGYSRDELLRMSICEVEAIESPDEVQCQIARVAETGFHRFEGQHRKKNGEIFDVEISASYFQATNEFLLFARDISRRKRAENELRQTEQEIRKLNCELEQRVSLRTAELTAVNKELEAFNYAVAHDLRAPLRQIHGFADILSEEAATVLDESAQRHLDMIRSSVQHMEQLLNDLLTLSRWGRQEMSKQVCGLNSVVEEVVNVLQPEIKDRQIEWRIAELPFLECDPGLIKQVMMNLLSNALKFTRPRKPAIIEIGEQIINGEPVVFVRDNGVGFSMKYADKLFGVFQRLHRQQDFEGTGVGLAIVERIIHRHGGKVWAEGELNKGATFYFTLHSSAIERGAQATKQEVAYTAQ